jgi:hypothetical protein
LRAALGPRSLGSGAGFGTGFDEYFVLAAEIAR